MEKDKIALVGFRATGKSLIGSLVAKSLGWAFVDMDDRLVETFGGTIQEWVAQHGWDAFREEEAKLLAQLGKGQRVVVATGGGVVLRSENRRELTELFHVIWLQARKDTILARLSLDPRTAAFRPALTGLSQEDEIESLLRERRPLYEEVADLVVATDDATAEDIVACVLKSLNAAPPH